MGRAIYTKSEVRVRNYLVVGGIGSQGRGISGTSVCGSIGSVGVGRGGIGSTSISGCGVGSVDGGGNDSLGDSGLLVHNSVESVDGISSVINNATSSVSLNKRVRSLDDISVAGLVLLLVVSGQSIGNGVRVGVLRMSIILSRDNSLGDGGGSGVGGNSGSSIGSTSVGRCGVSVSGGSIGSTSVGRCSVRAVCRGSGIGSHSGGSSVAQRGNHTGAGNRDNGSEGKNLRTIITLLVYLTLIWHCPRNI